MLWIGVLALVICAIITLVSMGGGFGKALHPILKRFPKPASFVSGAILGIFIGLIPGATIGWFAGSKIVGAIVCFICAAGCGYVWMKFEMRAPQSETRTR